MLSSRIGRISSRILKDTCGVNRSNLLKERHGSCLAKGFTGCQKRKDFGHRVPTVKIFLDLCKDNFRLRSKRGFGRRKFPGVIVFFWEEPTTTAKPSFDASVATIWGISKALVVNYLLQRDLNLSVTLTTGSAFPNALSPSWIIRLRCPRGRISIIVALFPTPHPLIRVTFRILISNLTTLSITISAVRSVQPRRVHFPEHNRIPDSIFRAGPIVGGVETAPALDGPVARRRHAARRTRFVRRFEVLNSVVAPSLRWM
jgi:hypothetical protein